MTFIMLRVRQVWVIGNFETNDEKMRIRLNKFYVFIFILALMVLYTLSRNRKLTNNAKYTIGITGKIYWTTMSGRQVNFFYTIDSKTYTGSENYLNDSISNNCKCRYFVEFDRKNPTFSKLLQSKPVPDSIKSAPRKGWSTIPGE
jgi:hypothetical protein